MRMVDAGKPRQSPLAIWSGSFDAWVESDILPAIETGALDHDMIDVVAALRAWETDGTWERVHLLGNM